MAFCTDTAFLSEDLKLKVQNYPLDKWTEIQKLNNVLNFRFVVCVFK